jgi:hypothetical protein
LEDTIQILKEIEEFIIPLHPEQFKQLEKNIIEEGCRDPLVIWEKDDETILIDGHNRYKICTKHDIPYETTNLKFDFFDDVKIWLINNQIGRRNLNPEQIGYYRGLKYESLKEKVGGYKNVVAKGKSDFNTSSRVAKEFKVSESTIKRDAKFANGIDFIGKYNWDLKNEVLSGNATLNKSDILLLSEKEVQQKIRKIVNVKDLQIKIKKIKDEIVSNALPKQRDIVEDQKGKILNEPLFLDNSDKITQLKGKILSALNTGIRNNNIKSLNEIIDHVESLKSLIALQASNT